MPVNIGPKIGIDGEAEFRKNLNSIAQQIKTLGTEMKAVTSAFDANDKSQENLAAQAEVLNKQISLQEDRLSEISKALEYAKNNYDENSNEVQRWTQAMNNATTDLNKMRSRLSDIESEMSDTGDAADDMADGFDDAGDAAGKADSKISTVSIAIGNLAANAISAAVSGLKDLASAFLNLDETTEEYRIAQGRVNTAFEAAGYSTEAASTAYTEFYKILGETDTAAEASQLLAQLTESEQDLTEWTRIAAGVSGTFGDSLPIEGLIEAANETAKVGEVTGVLADALNWVGISEDEFNESLAECSDESERNQKIMETLAGAYDDASDAFYENNDALIQNRENQAKLDESLAILGDSVQRLKNRLLTEFIPGISDVAVAFSDLISGVEGADQEFSNAISDLVTEAVNKLPEFLDFGVQIITSVASGIIGSVPTLVASVPDIINSLLTALVELLPEILNMGTEMLNQLTTGIETGLPNMLARIPEIIVQFLTYITSQLPSILQAGTDVLNSLVTGIIEAIPMMVQSLPQIITAFVNYISVSLPTIIECGGEILINLVSGIIGALPQLIEAVPQIVEAIIEGIVALASNIVEIGKNIDEWIIEGLTSTIGEYFGIGEDIIRGIYNGIKSAASSILMPGLVSTANTIVNTVKRQLGIASPSKVFADIGEDMALGLEKGWDNEYGRIEKNISSGLDYGISVYGNARVVTDEDANALRQLYANASTASKLSSTINNAAAGVVNGLSTMGTGGGYPSTIVLQLENGVEIARWLLPDLRSVMRSNPEVVSGV